MEVTLCLPSRLSAVPAAKATIVNVLGRNVVGAVNMPLLSSSTAHSVYARRVPPMRAAARQRCSSARAQATPRTARNVWNSRRLAAAESSSRRCGSSGTACSNT